MSPASNRRPHPGRRRDGTASLEFALVAIPFLFLLIAGMDLGRYFITQHSLRTLISEAVRATLVSCYGSSSGCSLPSASQTTVAAKVPFLASGSITWVTPPNQGAPNASTGVRTISVTVSYPFTFILPIWTSLNANSPITESTTFQY
jgi:Flp pilus assembly protein TadG